VEEIRIEILEEQPLVGAAADIGVIADLIPHAFAIISLLTPIDRIKLDPKSPLLVGRHEGLTGQRESYARMNASFHYQGRPVKLVIDVGTWRRTLVLPRALVDAPTLGAKFDDHVLKIRFEAPPRSATGGGTRG